MKNNTMMLNKIILSATSLTHKEGFGLVSTPLKWVWEDNFNTSNVCYK